MITILIIEDDPTLVELLAILLKLGISDINVISANNGTAGLKIIEEKEPDLVMLDLGLPDISGYEVLRLTRLITNVPIIIISIRTEELEIAKALEIGANDYMIKPFRKIELIARIKNLLRNKITPDVISQPHGPFHFGSTFMDLYINERLVSLTYAEGKLINKMLSTKNRQLSYKEISETIWGQYHTNDKILIKNYILRLRKKIEDTPNDPKYLRNIRNYGYSLL